MDSALFCGDLYRTLSLSGNDIYDRTAARMVLLAHSQPGFLNVRSARGDDGIFIIASYWEDRPATANLRHHAEHNWARASGRREFCTWYLIRVAHMVPGSNFVAGNVVKDATMPAK